jgi:hypothetical protein
VHHVSIHELINVPRNLADSRPFYNTSKLKEWRYFSFVMLTSVIRTARVFATKPATSYRNPVRFAARRRVISRFKESEAAIGEVEHGISETVATGRRILVAVGSAKETHHALEWLLRDLVREGKP